MFKSRMVSLCFAGYIGEFEIVDDHRNGKIVVNLTGRLNKVTASNLIGPVVFLVILGKGPVPDELGKIASFRVVFLRIGNFRGIFLKQQILIIVI